MSIVVGVDAGGTATNVVAMRDDAVVGEFVGGAANVRVAGVEGAADTIARAIGSALAGAEAGAAYVGAAGAGRDDVADVLAQALRSRLPRCAIEVSDDARIALRAAVPDGDGAVLIAGTGSIAYGEFNGATYRVGGHGYLVGDEGSAFAIGSAAVRLALRTYDGRALRDEFIAAIEAEIGARDPQAMVGAIYDAQRPVSRLASLAPIVLDFAGKGERSATKIVQSAALDLFELVKTLVRNAGVADREFSLALSGGMLGSNSLLSYLLETRIAGDLPYVRPIKGAPAPQFGAARLARALLATA